MKKATPRGKEMMNGAMKLAADHPSIGPWVRERMKQIREPIMRTTPTMSSRFHLGVPSDLYDEPV
jgi:hypothetical protein